MVVEPSSGGKVGNANVLMYACSGGANVAEAADRACRQLMNEGRGTMFCLAGIGARIDAMDDQARNADLNLVVDGCPMDCARRTFERLGLANARFARATDLGLTKQAKGARATDAEIETLTDRLRAMLDDH